MAMTNPKIRPVQNLDKLTETQSLRAYAQYQDVNIHSKNPLEMLWKKMDTVDNME